MECLIVSLLTFPAVKKGTALREEHAVFPLHSFITSAALSVDQTWTKR